MSNKLSSEGTITFKVEKGLFLIQYIPVLKRS